MNLLPIVIGFLHAVRLAAPFPFGGEPPGRLAAWTKVRAPGARRPLVVAPDAGHSCSFRNERRAPLVLALVRPRFVHVISHSLVLFLLGRLVDIIITLKSYLSQARYASDFRQVGPHAGDLYRQPVNCPCQSGSIHRGLRFHMWLHSAPGSDLAAQVQAITGVIGNG